LKRKSLFISSELPYICFAASAERYKTQGVCAVSEDKKALGFVTAALLLGLILSSIDQTIVSTAMPTIVKQLGGLSLYSWVFSVYMLASTTTMPVYGKLADLFGRKKVYLIGLSVFLTGSACCGIAESMVELIIFRGMQGLGAGALMPVTFTIVGDILPPEKRGKFMGLFGTVFALSSILGPAVGGNLVEHWHWSWIFYINLPIGIIAFILMYKGLNEDKSKRQSRTIDWFGVITLTGSIVSILLALVLGGSQYNWSSEIILGLFASGAVLLGLFIAIETKAKEPVIPLSLFRIRTITFSSISGFFMSAAMFGAIAYIPLFVQGVIGVSPSIAGYIMAPLMISVAITSTVSGRLMNRMSFRAILIPSLVLMAGGFLLLSQVNMETTVMQMIIYMVITGLGTGAVYPTLGTAAQSAVEWNQRGVATSSSQFFRSIGGTLGVSVLGSLLTRRTAEGMNNLSTSIRSDQLQHLINPQTLLDEEIRRSLSYDILLGLRTVYSHALGEVFLAGFICVVAALTASFLLGNARLVKASKG
jgi:EmrB/QacA subfamily drug resistance transporter